MNEDQQIIERALTSLARYRSEMKWAGTAHLALVSYGWPGFVGSDTLFFFSGLLAAFVVGNFFGSYFHVQAIEIKIEKAIGGKDFHAALDSSADWLTKKQLGRWWQNGIPWSPTAIWGATLLNALVIILLGQDDLPFNQGGN